MMSLNVIRDLFVECHKVHLAKYGHSHHIGLSNDCLDKLFRKIIEAEKLMCVDEENNIQSSNDYILYTLFLLLIVNILFYANDIIILIKYLGKKIYDLLLYCKDYFKHDRLHKLENLIHNMNDNMNCNIQKLSYIQDRLTKLEIKCKIDTFIDDTFIDDTD
jgi:hypothetical protein